MAFGPEMKTTRTMPAETGDPTRPPWPGPTQTDSQEPDRGVEQNGDPLLDREPLGEEPLGKFSNFRKILLGNYRTNPQNEKTEINEKYIFEIGRNQFFASVLFSPAVI